jgi:hypothetical protein
MSGDLLQAITARRSSCGRRGALDLKPYRRLAGRHGGEFAVSRRARLRML